MLLNMVEADFEEGNKLEEKAEQIEQVTICHPAGQDRQVQSAL